MSVPTRRERAREWDRIGSRYIAIRERNWRKYGIVRANGAGSLDYKTYRAVVGFQGGGCAICEKGELFGALHADHDRRSGLFRGGLCGDCNRKVVGVFERFGTYKNAEIESVIRGYLTDPPYQRYLRSLRVGSV